MVRRSILPKRAPAARGRRAASARLAPLARLALALSLALWCGAEARGQCVPLRIVNSGTENWQGPTGAGYESFDPVDRVQVVTVRVRKVLGSCTYAVGITPGGSGGYSPRELSRGADRLAYNLYDSPGQAAVLTDPPDGGAFITGSLSDPFIQTVSHTLYWVIPAGQVLAGGNARYEDVPTLRLYEQRAGRWVLQDTANRRFRARLSRAVELSLVDSGAPFLAADLNQTLDFGVLSTGEQLSFDLRARGNTAFDVTMHSLGSGSLQHTGSSSRVPYTLTVGGSAIDLSSGAAVPVARFPGPSTDSQGEVYPVVVTVGSLAGTAPGLHRDSITVSLIAR